MKLWMLAAALSLAAFAQPNDLDRLQGSWKIVSLSLEGLAVPEAQFRTARFVVAGNHFTSTGMGDDYAGTLAIENGGVALRFTEGPEKGNVNYAIYEVDGDRWRLCLNTTGGARPAKFASGPASGVALEILQRVSDLEGEWSMVSGSFDGQPLPAGYVRMGKRVVAGNEMTVTFGGELYSKATFTVDRSKTPIAIDIQNTAGANAGKTQYGIYERDGNNLKLSVAAPGRDRPTDFTSAAADGRTVVIWTQKQN